MAFKLKLKNTKWPVLTKVNSDLEYEYTFEHNEVPFAYKMERIHGFNGWCLTPLLVPAIGGLVSVSPIILYFSFSKLYVMKTPLSIQNIEDLLIPIKNQQMLIDRDVAQLYGVATKRINEAVKNNPDKFPEGYLTELNDEEKKQLVENFDHLQSLKYAKTNPKAFSEKGVYMLATILKSKQATQTTFLIIETFAKLRALQQTVAKLSSPELVSGSP